MSVCGLVGGRRSSLLVARSLRRRAPAIVARRRAWTSCRIGELRLGREVGWPLAGVEGRVMSSSASDGQTHHSARSSAHFVPSAGTNSALDPRGPRSRLPQCPQFAAPADGHALERRETARTSRFWYVCVTHMSTRDANLLGALGLALADRLAEAGPPELSGSAAEALVTLNGRRAGSSIDALAGIVGLSHSGTVRLADRLAAAGLVERRRGADQRSTALYLTPVWPPCGPPGARREGGERCSRC